MTPGRSDAAVVSTAGIGHPHQRMCDTLGRLVSTVRLDTPILRCHEARPAGVGRVPGAVEVGVRRASTGLGGLDSIELRRAHRQRQRLSDIGEGHAR